MVKSLTIALGASTVNPKSVSVGDFNRDSFLDIAVANNGANTVRVFQNNAVSGSIGFSVSLTIFGTDPNSIALGDVDGDGYPDIVAANTTSNSISVLRTSATGTLSFTTNLDISGASATAASRLAVGDLNADGWPDIVATTSGSSNNVAVFIQNVRAFQSLTITSLSTTNVGLTMTIITTRSITPTNLISGANTSTYSITATSAATGGGSATINSSGLLTAIAAGTITLTVSAAGDTNYRVASTSQLLTIGKSTPTLRITSPNLLVVGGVMSLTVTSTALTGGGGAVSYMINNGFGGSAGAATVTTSQLTAQTVGQVLLTASSVGDSNYYPTSVTQTIQIFPAPGAVSNGMTLWLRADGGSGSVSATAAGYVSSWIDQSRSITVTANQATPVGGASSTISVTAAGLNYNPIVAFSNKKLIGTGNFNFSVSNTMIGVAQYTSNSGNTYASFFCSYSTAPNRAGIIATNNNASLTFGYALDGSGGSGSYTQQTFLPSIVAGMYANASNTKSLFKFYSTIIL